MKRETRADTSTNREVQTEYFSNLDNAAVGLRQSPPVLPSYVIFFFSGAAALIYEISWSRQIGLLLGQTVQAASVVLSAYFAGLALGYLLGGRWAKWWSPLRAYGLAELFVAAWACLIPQILSWATTESLGHASFQVRFVINTIVCFLLLLPATVALGATLPWMAEFLSPNSRLSTGRVSLAYALNTLGGVLGVVSTFGLLVVVGVRGSSYIAAGLSAGCGLAALFLASYSQDQKPTAANTSSDRGANTTRRPVHFRRWEIVAGLSGFCTLALEVLYTRMFSLVFQNSTYTFGAVLAVFLVALAMGSLAISFLHHRFKPESILVVSGSLASLGIFLSISVFLQKTQLEYFSYGDSFAAYLLGSIGLVTLVILPPVVLIGMILPIAWKSTEDSIEAGGRALGRLTMINTLSAAAGAVSASFLLLPVLGLWRSFAAIAGLFGLIALGSLLRQRRFVGALASAVSIGVVLVLALPRFALLVSQTGKEGEVLRRWESAYGWIDVVRAPGGALQIRQNVHYRMGATGLNATREYRQSHLPLLLHEHPKNVLFLGLGTGLTAGAATQHEEVKHIQIVELIPEVVEAARLFSEDNFNVVDHPKVTVQIDDARHYLVGTDRRFDVIVSDLFVPWESRTGYLYTIEHYRIARERLGENGLFCQWIPLYQVGSEEFESIAESFASVFPHTTLWWGQMQSHRAMVALVGCNQPVEFDAMQINSRIKALQSSGRFSDSYFSNAAHLVGLFIGEWMPQDFHRLNTDEHPWVEFLAPISHQNNTLLQGLELLAYFDRVLSRLPMSGIHLPSEGPEFQPEKTRRAWQRFLLFGESS